MNIQGKPYLMPCDLWDDVNTDMMAPSAFLRVPEEELGNYAFHGIIDNFKDVVADSQILIAGTNFGCGSSREQAPKALLRCGIKLIIAQSYGYIFYRNAVNLGLGVITHGDTGQFESLRGTDEILDVGLESGAISGNKGFTARADGVAPVTQKILSAGGLLPLLKQDLNALSTTT